MLLFRRCIITSTSAKKSSISNIHVWRSAEINSWGNIQITYCILCGKNCVEAINKKYK